MALLKTISDSAVVDASQELFLIKIDNYETNENFYGSEIAQYLEIEFVKTLDEYKKLIGDYDIYHTASGKYALLLRQGNPLKTSTVTKFCTQFCEDVKKNKYNYNEYHFDVNITMSFSASSKTLYEDANAILTEAISEKKDFLLSYDVIDSIKNVLKENLNMHKTIKIALKNGNIRPYFQPIYNLKTDEVNRYEALVRLIDEDGSIVPPGPYFLEVAKKGKLYSQVTKVLFEQVLKKIREHKCEISINLSSLDIEDRSMSEYLLELLCKNRDITDKLIFELLEDKETQDYEYVNNFINRARAYGVKIAIDDFGSGYSNFIRIIEFKPEIIKIDGSLIEDITHSKSHRQTVEAIKLFSEKIGAKTVAEYVINQDTFDIIKEIGIDYAQGFHIGKANPKLLKELEVELELA
jgi:EAL domain-containing protein (putative c-di-GMP-specific phosphodiesterase class I)